MSRAVRRECSALVFGIWDYHAEKLVLFQLMPSEMSICLLVAPVVEALGAELQSPELQAKISMRYPKSAR